jgi:hypothetical protein
MNALSPYRRKKRWRSKLLEPRKIVNYTSAGDRAGSSAPAPQWTTTYPTFNFHSLPYIPQYLPLLTPPAAQPAQVPSVYHHG